MVASSGSGSRDGGNSGKSRGGGGGGGDDGGGGSQQAVKKGPWTTAEDAILIEYVRKHGEGNWNAVQRNSGLLRCGKSCRLRWANHLRPNLKRGSFSPEEESLIIELHAKLGNKWARMASQLPGRTDNEIKNYWNTRVKRLQRAGLPIYPDEIPLQYDQPQLLPRNRNFSSPSFSSLLSSSSSSSQFSSNSKFSPSLSLFNPFNYPTMANPLQAGNSSSFLSNPNHQFKPFHENGSGSSFSLPLTSPILPFSPSPPSLYNYPLQFSPRPIMGGSFNGGEIELPSIQSPLLAVTTPPSSGSICGDHYMIETPSDADEYYIAPELPNSGLLDALVEESKSLAQAENLKKELSFPAGKDKAIWVSDTGLSEDAADGFHGSSSAHSSIGMKADEPLEDMNPIDDDLSSLLNNFPLTVPLPDWYDASPNNSNGQSSNMNNGNSGLNNQPEASPSPLATTNPKWSNMGSSCSWNNMPGIC